jgi:hypothetical protein
MRRAVRTLASLTLRDWQTLTEALALVWHVRIALWTIPLDRVRRRFAGALPSTSNEAAADPKTIALAVRRASRLVPKASCLTQALAARELLARRGIVGRLKIGVARKDGALEAHAWVEHDGRIVLGRVPNMERFAVLPESAMASAFPARIDGAPS